MLSGHLTSIKKRLADRDVEFRAASNANDILKAEFMQVIFLFKVLDIAFNAWFTLRICKLLAT